MRRWMAAPALFATACVLAGLTAAPVAAQPKAGPPVEESFVTADGFLLRGLFHKAVKDADTAPIVVFLYPPGADQDMSKGDWGGLAKRLNEEGFHVFRFDWRGHGKSKDISDTDKFWGNTFTGRINTNFIDGAKKKPVKDDFEFKDLKMNATKYMPVYLNDLTAMRLHLDKKNDNAKINTSSIYVIGVGDAVPLGMAWINAEWNRPSVAPTQAELGAVSYQFVPQLPPRLVKSPAGADIAAAVWISPTLKVPAISRQLMQGWVNSQPTKLRTTPMLFLTGDKDNPGQKDTDTYFKEILVADPPKGSTFSKADKTFSLPVKGAGDLKGMKLLGDNATLNTETLITRYMVEQIQKKRPTLESSKREYKEPYFIDLRGFGINVAP